MYGVVVCPRCRKAKGVALSQKTTACPCGFDIHVVPARVRARTSIPRELPGLVGEVNAEIAGGLAAYRDAARPRKRPRSRNVHARVVASAVRAGDRMHRIRAAAEGLTRELDVFSLDDWREVLGGLGLVEAEEALQELLKGNVVYEPRPGFFRTVPAIP